MSSDKSFETCRCTLSALPCNCAWHKVKHNNLRGALLMKVRINTDGSMEFDIDNVEDAAKAAAFARAAAAAETPTVVVVKPEPEKRPRQPKVKDSELNAMQYRVWEFLVENDSEKGVHIAAVARHVGIKHDNVSWWCNTLVRLGYAKRVSRGYYRPLGGAVAE